MIILFRVVRIARAYGIIRVALVIISIYRIKRFNPNIRLLKRMIKFEDTEILE